MSARMLTGLVAFAAGALLWLATRRVAARSAPPGAVARSLPRLGVAAASLGLSVMASAQPGVSWSISSICFSVIAIVLLAVVARDSLRR